MRVFVSAAEASGDALGSSLMEALAAQAGVVEAYGLAGQRMRAAGVEPWRNSEMVGVNGLIEVVRHVPRLMRLAHRLSREALRRRPDVAVLIDAPDFNIRLARRLHTAGVPVVFYGAPTVWAWRPGRVRTYVRLARRMLVLFPFELAPWREADVDAECVGHPLVDALPEPAPAHLVEPGTFAMLPGSRPSEVRRHLPVFFEAARRLKAQVDLRRLIVPVAPGLDLDAIHGAVRAAGLAPVVTLLEGGTEPERHAALARAAGAWVAAGTASLELALLGCPHQIVYRVHPLTYALGRRLIRVRYIGLPNLVAGTSVSPELLQDDLRPEPLVAFARRVLSDGAYRAEMVSGLAVVRQRLPGAGASHRAARAVLRAGMV